MLNGAVAAGHRGKRLQSRISAAIFEESVRRRFVFCFGTGNRWSTGPLLSRFSMVRPLQARLGFGMPARRQTEAQPSFERLWSPEALAWRLANPEASYAVGVRNGNFSVTAKIGLPGISAILLSAPDEWNGIERGGPSPTPLRLWLGLDPNLDWSRSPFLPIPRSLRPSPLNLVYKDLTGGGFVPDPDRVRFRAIDFDLY